MEDVYWGKCMNLAAFYSQDEKCYLEEFPSLNLKQQRMINKFQENNNWNWLFLYLVYLGKRRWMDYLIKKWQIRNFEINICN